MSLASVVDPTAVRSTAVDVVSDLPPPDGGPIHAVAELHRYVDDTITYDPDPGPAGDVAPSAETLETERGNYDCQAVLLASLLKAVDAPTRLVRRWAVVGTSRRSWSAQDCEIRWGSPSRVNSLVKADTPPWSRATHC